MPVFGIFTVGESIFKNSVLPIKLTKTVEIGAYSGNKILGLPIGFDNKEIPKINFEKATINTDDNGNVIVTNVTNGIT
jgi:hypothetical protein